MNFPPSFLDEICHRVSLPGTIQRRTRLVKKGREWSGLCPFHNEKSPSFTVNEDKGFFHCFGCGAHGDVIGFVMRAENRGFVEAVEALAAEAGLEIPKPSPQAQEEAKRQATIFEVMEAAQQFFAAQLETQAGSAARAYLQRRGLDRVAIERFGLGYAPGGQGLLQQHLSGRFPEALITAAGLAIQRENAPGSYDYFRDRVIFPIYDRRGRVIAFGGRVLGDAKPKYLNSPETPIFHKGSTLYGLNWAREASGEGDEVPIVTEGYMDVIALQLAGFRGAVAPLGTALTPEQLEAVWRLGAEPVLCFDGDAAGGRAAVRAVERALPLLKAGRSLRLASLPAGEDPDTLIRRFGAEGMRQVVGQAQPLAEFIWGWEVGQRTLDTPERRADLARRLEARSAQLTDQALRREYSSFFRNCQFERLDRRGRGRTRSRAASPEVSLPNPVARMDRCLQEALVVLPLRNPEILEIIVEEFGALVLKVDQLDSLRREIINVHETLSDLDALTLRHHLTERGFGESLAVLDRPGVIRLSGDADDALTAWRDAVTGWSKYLAGNAEIEAAVSDSERDPEGAYVRLVALSLDAEHQRVTRAEAEEVHERKRSSSKT